MKRAGPLVLRVPPRLASLEMTRFVILTTQRSGGTLFRLWLAGHPAVRCHGEVFLRGYPAADGFERYSRRTVARRFIYSTFAKPSLAGRAYNPVAGALVRGFLTDLFYNPSFTAPWTDFSAWRDYRPREAGRLDRVVGFHLMYSQLRNYRILGPWIRDQHVSVIHLIRWNALKLLLSRLIATQTGVFHSFDKGFSEMTTRRIVVDAGTVRAQLDRILRQREEMASRFSRNPYLEITYEDFLSRHFEITGDVSAFLGVERIDLGFSNMRKLNPDSVQELVVNFDQLSSALRGTPYEIFLQ